MAALARALLHGGRSMKRIALFLLPLLVLSGCAVQTTPTADEDRDETADGVTESKPKKKKKDTSSDDDSEGSSARTTTATTPAAPAETPAAPAGPDVTLKGTVTESKVAQFGGISAG